MTSVKYLLFYMELLNYSFRDLFGSVLGCYELTYISFTVHKLCRYNNEQATKQTKAINNSYIFVVVNFDALAQASDIQIERRQVVFLCWMQDLNPGNQTPNRQQTISCKCDTNRAGHFTIDAHASRPLLVPHYYIESTGDPRSGHQRHISGVNTLPAMLKSLSNGAEEAGIDK